MAHLVRASPLSLSVRRRVDATDLGAFQRNVVDKYTLDNMSETAAKHDILKDEEAVDVKPQEEPEWGRGEFGFRQILQAGAR